MGLSLYSESYIPQGCRYVPGSMGGPGDFTRYSSTQCDIKQGANMRAVALMNFAFNCHVIAVVVFSVFSFGIVAKAKGHCRSASTDFASTDFKVESELVQLQQNKLSFDRR